LCMDRHEIIPIDDMNSDESDDEWSPDNEEKEEEDDEEDDEDEDGEDGEGRVCACRVAAIAFSQSTLAEKSCDLPADDEDEDDDEDDDDEEEEKAPTCPAAARIPPVA